MHTYLLTVKLYVKQFFARILALLAIMQSVSTAQLQGCLTRPADKSGRRLRSHVFAVD